MDPNAADYVRFPARHFPLSVLAFHFLTPITESWGNFSKVSQEFSEGTPGGLSGQLERKDRRGGWGEGGKGGSIESG